MVAPLIGLAMPVIGELVDRLLPDSAEREKVKLEYEAKMTQAISAIDVAQLEVQKAEAGHASLFVAGARPFIMWTCGFGFAYHVIVQPLLMFICAALQYPIDLPVFNTELLVTVMVGMLGLGTMRTYEKRHEVDTKVVLPWLKRNKD